MARKTQIVMTQKNIALPIESVLCDIGDSLSSGLDVILRASPGSGKTTRVPPFLLSLFKGQIWVLEPRRIAARMSATRVAEELGEKPGRTVGWQMRFDREYSEKTRILFLTEGMFTAKLAQNPNLDGVDCVILDEFHERHQQTDVAFALCRHLQQTSRKNLRLVVMSATLDTQKISSKMGGSRTINLELPLFPVSVTHEFVDTNIPLSERVSSAVLRLVNTTTQTGHILAFLPGTAEILKTKKNLSPRVNHEDWSIIELRGTLDKADQQLAFQSLGNRKIILATNIAESSLTISGVSAVVDSGIAKVPSFNPFNNLSTIETRPVSKASLTQRAGRAGRTGAGLVVRLFSKHDEASRPDVDVPEILRLDLSQVYMSLLWLSFQSQQKIIPEDLPWADMPDDKLWNDAKLLLQRLGIVDADMQLLRPDMAKIPLHPRLACFLTVCAEVGHAREAPWLTALLANPGDAPKPTLDSSHLGCDLLAQFDLLRAAPHYYPNIQKTAQQLSSVLGQPKLSPIKDCCPPHDINIAKAFMRAFPDRVAQIRRKTAHSKWIDATLCGGGDLLISAESASSHGEWLIALDATSSRTSGSVSKIGELQSSVRTLVTLATMIQPTDFIDAPDGFLISEEAEEIDLALGKAKRYRTTRYGILTVSKNALGIDASAISSQLMSNKQQLIELLHNNWPSPFENSLYFETYLHRQALAFKQKRIEHCWNKSELLELLIAFIADSCSSYKDVTQHTLEEWVRYCVGENEFQELAQIAPTHIMVGRGFKVEVNYSESAPPWIAARLQNFFGQTKTPRILGGTQELTVHLLAPNMRALQVTTDLESFWRNTYPALRNEYQRKYPRHVWPENPLLAEPPTQRPRKK